MLNNFSLSGTLFTKLATLICRFRLVTVLLLTLCTAVLIWQAQGLTFDNSEDIWFVQGDPSLERVQKFRKIFGNDDFVFMMVDTKHAFTKDSFTLLEKLTLELETQVPYVQDITWLGNAEYMEGKEQSIIISELFDADSTTDADMVTIKQKGLAEKLFRNNFISTDGDHLGLIIELGRYPADKEDPRTAVAQSIKQIMSKKEYASLAPHIVGQPVLHNDYNMLSLSESQKFFGLCLLVQLVLLFKLARGLRGVLTSIAVVFFSVIWTMGMIHVLGYTLNLFIILVPTLLVCIGIGDSMHIISTFNTLKETTGSNREAVVQAVGEVGPPCLLTSITTAAGFLAFNAADIRPFREMGVYASIGTMAAFFLSVTLVPLIYSRVKSTSGCKNTLAESPAASTDFFHAMLLKIARVNIAAPKWIIAFFVVLTACSCLGYSYVEVETNTARMLSPDLQLRQAYDQIDSTMGGSMSVELMFNTGAQNGIKNPDFLKKLETFQRKLEALPYVTNTVSIIDLLKKINQSMHGNNSDYYTLPDSRSSIAQYMLLYELADGQEMDKLLSFKNDVARLTVKTTALGTKQVRNFTEYVDKQSSEIFGKTASVEMAGHLYWMKAMNDLLGAGQQKSFLTAIIVISLLMTICLRSLKLGLISIVPNVFPVLITLGLMGLSGMYMDMPLMSFSAIIIGVAVDDTIHFLFRFKKEFARLGSYKEAIESTLLRVGRPLIFTTVTLSAGFSVLVFSDLTGVSKFGGLACFAFIWALLADFFFVPALILICKPLGAEAVTLVQHQIPHQRSNPMQETTIGVIGGLGRVGKETVKYLLQETEHTIVIGGRTCKEDELFLSERVSFAYVDVFTPQSINTFCAGCSIVINCAGPSALIKDTVALAALENDAHYVDPGGHNPVYHTLTEHEQAFQQKNLVSVLATGILPGLSEVFPIYEAQQNFDAIYSMEYYYIGRDEWTHNSAYDIAWGVGNIGKGEAPVFYRNGIPEEVNLLTSGKKVQLPLPLGECKLFPVLREELREFIDKNRIQDVSVYGNNWGVWVSLATIAVKIAGWFKSARQLHQSADLIVRAAKKDLKGKSPGFMLHLSMRGEKNNKPLSLVSTLYFEDTYRATGICAAVAAQMIAENKVPAGRYWASQLPDIETYMQLFLQQNYSITHNENFAYDPCIPEAAA